MVIHVRATERHLPPDSVGGHPYDVTQIWKQINPPPLRHTSSQ